MSSSTRASRSTRRRRLDFAGSSRGRSPDDDAVEARYPKREPSFTACRWAEAGERGRARHGRLCPPPGASTRGAVPRRGSRAASFARGASTPGSAAARSRNLRRPDGRAGGSNGCNPRGRRCTIVEFAPGRPSVGAVLRGGGDGPRLLLNGHMDTVPIDDEALWCVRPVRGRDPGRLSVRAWRVRHEGGSDGSDRRCPLPLQARRAHERLARPSLRCRRGMRRAGHAVAAERGLHRRLRDHDRADAASRSRPPSAGSATTRSASRGDRSTRVALTSG